MLKYVYADTTCSGALTSVIALNLAYQYCDPLADSCAIDTSWRRSQYSYTHPTSSTTAFNVSDQAGDISQFINDKWGRVASYKPPRATNQTSFTYCESYFTSVTPGSGNNVPTLSGANPPDPDESFCGEMVAASQNGVPATWTYTRNRILTATRSGGTWFYSQAVKLSSNSPYPRQYTISRPLASGGGQNQILTTVTIDVRPGGGLIGFQNASIANVSYSDDETGRMTAAQSRGQPARTFTYDNNQKDSSGKPYGPGNITSDGITSATYTYPCDNILTCNKPQTATDANGNVFTFKYDATKGGELVSETWPADANGINPQKRFTYVQLYAWYLNASGALVEDPNPIWKVASMSYCRTSAPNSNGVGCTGTNDEVVTTYDYGRDDGTIPNNLWLRGTIVTANGQSLRTCYGYSKYGDKISETSPRAGLTSCS
jgi:hypothetical protein